MEVGFETCTRKQRRRLSSSGMRDSSCKISSATVFFLFFLYSLSPVLSLSFNNSNQSFQPREESRKLKFIRAHLRRINKPALKTIQSPDGDVIDCVLSHKQPAFDHPKLRGQSPLDPPKRPEGHSPRTHILEDSFQLWSMNNEFCPEGTIPIRRTAETDVIRASSLQRFGKKIRPVRRDSTSNVHEHAVGYVSGQEYYGAKASINVWAPKVAHPYEFSLSQIWVIAGSFGDDLNTIEAGWQVSPELYGDNYPRFFTYWTDPKHGNWWLEFGNGVLVGYWPSILFTHLRSHASMVQFGGEIVNTASVGAHTATQMGSGHFAAEGFGKSSYFRNLQVVDWDNSLIPLSDLRLLADHQNCYDIRGGVNRIWGNYFFYGGPGKNPSCS